jgi:thiosulfate/3-mercaptopyruvate sulfurtransferase
MFRTLIDVDQLQVLRQLGADVVAFDCRHDLANPELGAQQYAQGRIPGAWFAHLDHDLSGAKTGKNGRHPLPDRAQFAQWLQARGVGDGTQVVCYDAAGSMFAARLWWMVRWIGKPHAAVLDGGLPAWTAAGGALDTALPVAKPTQLTLRDSLVPMVDADRVRANLDSPQYVLVDARAPERYAGEQELIDPVAGHIPGALNRFFKDNLQADGRFKEAGRLRAEFVGLLGDQTDVVHQCGSGATACHNILAMEIARLGTHPLYPGSWSEWCADPARPVATGRAP